MPYYAPGVSPTTEYQALLPLGKISQNSPWRTGTPCLFSRVATTPGSTGGFFAIENDPAQGIETRMIVGTGDLTDPDATVLEVATDLEFSAIDMYRWGPTNGECNLFVSKAQAALVVTATPTQSGQPLLQIRANDTSTLLQVGVSSIVTTPAVLPTSDPHLLGQLWNSAGTVKVSAGP